MRACLLALVAAFVCAATGCANLNLAKRGHGAVPCSEPVACAQPVGCAQPIGCTAAVSPYGPAAVSPYGPAGVAPYAPAPAAAPYNPGYAPYGGPAYGGGPNGAQGAAVAYPYYTTRGPRDFLLDNPPSIGR